MKLLIFLILFILSSCCNKLIKQDEITLKDINIIGCNRLRELGNDFLTDIGGKTILISSNNGIENRCVYFDPNLFNKNQTFAYKKWKQILIEPKNCTLAQLFEIDYPSNSLISFLSMPKNVCSIKRNNIGIIYFPSSDFSFELDPKSIITYLARGIHVLVVNYREQLDAQNAFQWLKSKIKTENKNIIISGKSFGIMPAVHLAEKNKETLLILDNPFVKNNKVYERYLSKFLRVMLSKFTNSFSEKYCAYLTEALINKISGKVIILEDMQNNNENDCKKIFNDCLRIRAYKGHCSKLLGYEIKSWHCDEESQKKLSQFLKNSL